MKIPKTKNAYCKKCRKHTKMKVSENRTSGSRGTLKRGSITRAKKRGLGRGFGNLGIYGSQPAIGKRKRTGAKSSKKTALKLTCTICNYSQIMENKRAKKLEFV